MLVTPEGLDSGCWGRVCRWLVWGLPAQLEFSSRVAVGLAHAVRGEGARAAANAWEAGAGGDSSPGSKLAEYCGTLSCGWGGP